MTIQEVYELESKLPNNQKDYYLPDYPWSIIKSYILTLDKTRKTKTAKLMRHLCDEYNASLKVPGGHTESFISIYFAFLIQRRPHFKYLKYEMFSPEVQVLLLSSNFTHSFIDTLSS